MMNGVMMNTDELHPVFVGNPDEADGQVLVVGGVEVLVPLEMDADGDPLQDDEIRLAHVCGAFKRVVRASDADAEPQADKGLILYRFRDVPPGVYSVAVRIGGRWSEVLTGLRVSKDGVFYGDEPLGDSLPELRLGSDGSGAVVFYPNGEPVEQGEASTGSGGEVPALMDLNPTFRDPEAVGR